MKLIRWKRPAAWVGGALLLPALSGAAVDPNPDLMALSLEELMQISITSSTLTEETLQTVPASMTVYTRADIRRLGLRDLADLLNYVPGYQGYRTDLNSLNRNISSRGRALSANGSEILVLIDGQRLNNDWSGGASQVDSLISLENVERVEFIRGPGSAIYGSNAMTGVINIVTGSRREAALEAGSGQLRRGSFQWHAEGVNGKLDVYASSARANGESLTIFNPTTRTEVDSHTPYGAADLYVRGELGEFSLAARAISRDAQQYYATGFTDPASTYWDTRSDFLNLGWRHKFGSGMTLDGRLSNSHKAFQLRSAISASGLMLEGGIKEQELDTQWTLQGDHDKLHWLVGWEWRNPRLTDTSAHVGTLSNPYSVIALLPQAAENGRIINSAFVQLQRPLTDTLAMTVGLRHDDYSDFGGHNSPRLALVQQWGTNDTLKVLYSEAFRAPNRSESGVINSSAIQQNPDLRPETARTTELIWMRVLQTGLVSATLFNTRVKDAIVEGTINVPPLKRQPINGALNVSGAEVEWQYRWSPHWQSRLALTHLFDPASDLHTQSNRLLGGSLSYERQGWSVTFLANYQGGTRDPNEQDVPPNITTTESTYFGGHAVYGAHVVYRVSSQWDGFLHVDNLFDKSYLMPAFRPENQVGVPGPGRQLTLGVHLYF